MGTWMWSTSEGEEPMRKEIAEVTENGAEGTESVSLTC